MCVSQRVRGGGGREEAAQDSTEEGGVGGGLKRPETVASLRLVLTPLPSFVIRNPDFRYWQGVNCTTVGRVHKHPNAGG